MIRAVFGLLIVVMVVAVLLGYLSSPWARFWLKGRNTIPPALIVDGDLSPIDPDNLALIVGAVSDAQRYQLARQAGWNAEDAILATAISLAENGSGNPAALSGVNHNGSRDLGLWQINSAWWPQFGGQTALIDPWRNAQAAYYIFTRQHWCAWSTYEERCGPGHNGSYRAFLARARAAAQVQSPVGQA